MKPNADPVLLAGAKSPSLNDHLGYIHAFIADRPQADLMGAMTKSCPAGEGCIIGPNHVRTPEQATSSLAVCPKDCEPLR
jgi:hypothetical protein